MSLIKAAVRSQSFSGRRVPDTDTHDDRRASLRSKPTSRETSTDSRCLKDRQSEQEALEELKSRIGDRLKRDQDDNYLRKWLKARRFDVDKAEDMFRKNISFREKHNVDSILEDYQPPKVLADYLAGGFCGHDKEGSPVRVELFGHLDMKGIMCSARRESLEKTKLLQCEQTVRDWRHQSSRLGRRVDGLTVIFDMENAGAKSLWRPGLQMYLHLVKILEDNYPEMMKRMFVINAPRVFPLLWKICRPLISEDMKNKIHVLGAGYPSVLLEYIDADQLPAFLGGKLTDSDGDPRCRNAICPGGEVPRSFYLSHIADTDNMETISVPKADQRRVDVTVTQPDSVLRWEFMSDKYDVAFGILRKEPTGAETEVLALSRVECHMIPEVGTLLCSEPGTYQLVFDNHFSWVRQKSIRYRCSVQPASTDDAE